MTMGICFGRDWTLRRVGRSKEVVGETPSLSVDQDPDLGAGDGRVGVARLVLETDFSRVSETQAREESLVDVFLVGLSFLVGL
jgi:hypothetical protein